MQPALHVVHYSVSIHAPYAGSDDYCEAYVTDIDVSIHAPYAGSDAADRNYSASTYGFNPRPLCRERLEVQRTFPIDAKVSIHAPYAGSDHELYQRSDGNHVSIHAPYAGSDNAE